jgi:hypothetical protein
MASREKSITEVFAGGRCETVLLMGRYPISGATQDAKDVSILREGLRHSLFTREHGQHDRSCICSILAEPLECTTPCQINRILRVGTDGIGIDRVGLRFLVLIHGVPTFKFSISEISQ